MHEAQLEAERLAAIEIERENKNALKRSKDAEQKRKSRSGLAADASVARASSPSAEMFAAHAAKKAAGVAKFKEKFAHLISDFNKRIAADDAVSKFKRKFSHLISDFAPYFRNITLTLTLCSSTRFISGALARDSVLASMAMLLTNTRNRYPKVLLTIIKIFAATNTSACGIR